MEIEVKQATFEGWAIVEMMGHRQSSFRDTREPHDDDPEGRG